MINRGGKTTCSLFLFEYLEGKSVWNLEKQTMNFWNGVPPYAIFMQYSRNLMQIQTIEPWWNTEALPPVFQKGTIQEHYRTLYVTYALIFLWPCQCAKKSDPLWKSLWSSQILCEILKSSWLREGLSTLLQASRKGGGRSHQVPLACQVVTSARFS